MQLMLLLGLLLKRSHDHLSDLLQHALLLCILFITVMTPPISTGWQAYWEFFKRGLRDSASPLKALTLIYSSGSVQQAYLSGTLLNIVIILIATLIMKSVKNMLWGGYLVPLYNMLSHLIFFLSLWVCSESYKKISERVNQKKEGSSTKSTNMPAFTLADIVAETLYRFLFISIYLGCVVMLYYIPYVGPLISFVPIAWIMAFYCFEFKWTDSKWKFKQQTEYFEEHWVYFAGFGLPLAFINTFVLWDGFPIVLICLFPCFIILATIATPVPRHKHEASARRVKHRVEIFYIPRRFSEMLLSILMPGSK